MPIKRIFLYASRSFFALLMLASAIGKLLDMHGFFAITATYQLLPSVLVPFSAWGLTLFELALGAALVWPRTWQRVVVLLIPIHLFYLVGLSSALLRGLNLPNCGCFGVFWPRPLTVWSIVEDVVLLSWAVAFYFYARQGAKKK
jgi:hypothetical protein